MFSSRISSTASLLRVSGIARCASTSQAAVYSKFGNPAEVLKVQELPLPAVGPKDVLIRLLAAPLNPADFNIIEGRYGYRPETFPAVGGGEGVAVVEAIGGEVAGLKKGDRVIAVGPEVGTWRTHAVVSSKHVAPISADIPVEFAATLSVNPCTALRLLSDIVPLQQGEYVIQNGASSVVGQSVIQIAKNRGLKTINVIRDAPDQDQWIERLKQLGGDIVVTESYLRSKHMTDLLKDVARPRLALNAVGGVSATELARLLKNGGTMVSYGGMSRQPLTIPVGLFIFNDINLRGFWMSEWRRNASEADISKMYSEVVGLVQAGKLRWGIETFNFNKFGDAVAKATSDDRNRKVVLRFD